MNASALHNSATPGRWKYFLRIGLFLLLILSLMLVGKQATHAKPHEDSLLRRTLSGWVSPATIWSIENDQNMRRSYTEVIDLAARSTEWLHERYPASALDKTGASLRAHALEMAQFDGDTGSSSIISLAKRQGLGKLFGGGGGGGGGIGGLISGGLAKIGNGLLDNISGAGTFLGIGIGEGASAGLNLTTMQNAMAVGKKVADSTGMKATGLNPIIESTSSSLVATFVGSLNVKSLLGGLAGGGITAQIAPAAGGLATGIGSGLVQGAGLAKQAISGPIKASNPQRRQTTALKTPSTNPSMGNVSIPEVANQFGFGLTNTIASSVDGTKLMAIFGMDGGAVQDQVKKLTANLAPVALGLASGLAGGAVTGLKFNNVAPPMGTGIADVMGAFGYGLTNATTSNINIKQVTDALGQFSGIAGGSGGGINQQSLLDMLPAAASGLGKGLGQGASVGLGAQPDPGTIPTKSVPAGQIDAEGVVHNFAFGLASRALQNGTIGKVAGDPSLIGLTGANSSGAALLGSVDFAKAAGGLARGVIQGAGDGITAMGGLQALLDGTATNVSDVPLTPLNMDDGLKGAAVGFGQGIASQGIVVGKVLAGQLSDRTLAKRDENIDLGGLVVRQTGDPNNAPVAGGGVFGNKSFNVSQFLTSDVISTVLQKGIDALTCEGVGGLALVGLGLFKSGVIPRGDSGMRLNLTQFRDVLPKDPIVFTNQGNSYRLMMPVIINSLQPLDINAINNGGFSVNGQGIVTFAVLTALHVFFAVLVMLIVLPAIIGIESYRNILMRAGNSRALPTSPKWVTISWLFVVAPSVILLSVFAIIARGDAAHFNTAHNVLGLITLLATLVASALHFLVKVKNGDAPLTGLGKAREVLKSVLLSLTVLTSTTGFGEVASATVCLTQVLPFQLVIGAGFGLATIFGFGTVVSGIDLLPILKGNKSTAKGSESTTEMGYARDEKRKGLRVNTENVI